MDPLKDPAPAAGKQRLALVALVLALVGTGAAAGAWVAANERIKDLTDQVDVLDRQLGGVTNELDDAKRELEQATDDVRGAEDSIVTHDGRLQDLETRTECIVTAIDWPDTYYC